VLRRATAFGLSARHDSATGDGISLLAARDDDRARCNHRGAHAHRHCPRHGDGVGAHAMGSRRTSHRRAADCIRSSRSRDRPSHRLSLLSRGCRAHVVGRAAIDPEVRHVPQPHVDVDQHHGADSPKSRDGPSDCLGARHAASRLRVLRSRDPRRSRRWMRVVSRTRGSHGDGRAGGSPNDGLVPRLSSRPGATTSPADRHHDDGMASCPVGHGRCTARSSGRPDRSPHRLHDLSSLGRDG
jgi:hypothetical protein